MPEAEFVTLTEPSDLFWFIHPVTGGLVPDKLGYTEDDVFTTGRVVGYSEEPAGLFIIWDKP